MNEKFETLQRLALDLKSQGFAREAGRISRLLVKEALQLDLDYLNQVRDELGDSILEMEYYPPGAGLFPEKQEIGIFFSDLNLEKNIREKLETLGFNFQALLTSGFFARTLSGVSSQAAKKLSDSYFVLVATAEEQS
jgi:hypothetical protein